MRKKTIIRASLYLLNILLVVGIPTIIWMLPVPAKEEKVAAALTTTCMALLFAMAIFALFADWSFMRRFLLQRKLHNMLVNNNWPECECKVLTENGLYDGPTITWERIQVPPKGELMIDTPTLLVWWSPTGCVGIEKLI